MVLLESDGGSTKHSVLVKFWHIFLVIHSQQTEQRITAYNKFVLAINYPLVYNNLGKQTYLSYKLRVIENVCMFAEKNELV